MTLQPRVRASAIHLAGSLLLILGALALVYLLWYPTPLDAAVGVTGVFLILIGVDGALGPLLTLLVYNPAKKSLRFDLGVIITVQLCAFAYGLWTVAEGRPAWLVFNTDRFDLVRINEIDPSAADQALPEYRQPSWFGPQWVAALPPKNPEERNSILFQALQGGSDLPQRPQYYRPLAQGAEQLRRRARDWSELERYNPAPAVSALRAAWPEADAWVPLKANAQSMTVLIHKGRAEVIAVVDLRPWY